MTERNYFFPTESNPHVCTDYPYGSLRCTKHWYFEIKKGKGVRLVEVTKNPKTNLRNNPKKSTYSDILIAWIDEKGHFAFGGWHYSYGGYEEMADRHGKITGKEWEERCNLPAIAESLPELKEHLEWCHKKGKKCDWLTRKFRTGEIEFKVMEIGTTRII